MTNQGMDRRRFVAASAAALGGALFRSPPNRNRSAAACIQSPRRKLTVWIGIGSRPAIRSRSISSVELTTLMLDRIEKLGPTINAVVTVTKDAALERAKAADEALARKEQWGPFHGVPCTVKDTLETAGVRTTAGARFLAHYVPKRDAAVVERLKKSGAVLLGKTNTPLMAGDGQTFNDVFGTTNNPYDLKRSPGGSSGGSAAALAAGMTFLCIGSDLAGSIRAPAHFCGIYGHKPSLGVVPNRGHSRRRLERRLSLRPILRLSARWPAAFRPEGGFDGTGWPRP